jgi:methanogenesis imperfect marker protein 11
MVTYCRGFYTLVDNDRNLVQIIEKCIANGPIEWDAINRYKASPLIKEVKVEGTTLIMNVRIGESEVNFGSVSENRGAQALKSVEIIEDKVKTIWLGLAGATIGIGSCLSEAPGIIKTVFNSKKIGGAHELQTTIVSPKLSRLIIGIDDTDSEDAGATWHLGLELGRTMPWGTFLKHKIIQLNPDVKEKTTNCVSVGISFGIEEKNIYKAIDYTKKFIFEKTVSDNTCIAIYKGIRIPRCLQKFSYESKLNIKTEEDAIDVARKGNVDILEITGTRGMIGAVAAIGYFDMGMRSSALQSDIKKYPELFRGL